jgi:CelD/BcsL family acetyltransferase involved in cellulose biosynthesis
MKLVIYSEFSEDLEHDWLYLEDTVGPFAQSYLGWVKGWCSAKKINNLRIVAVYHPEGKIAAIVPFWLTTMFGLKTIRSIPVHFGDFLAFICKESELSLVMPILFDYLQSYQSWSLIKVDNVCTGLPIAQYFFNSTLTPREETKVHIVDFWSAVDGSKDFDGYLKTLSRNRRQKTIRSFKQLQEIGDVKLEVIKSYTSYLHYFEDMKAIYVKRWGTDLDNIIYEYRNSALEAIFQKGIVRLYILHVDRKTVAYHLGFEYEGFFYSWKECADEAFAGQSLGNLMRVYLMPQDLISNSFRGINLMAGDYQYKKNRSEESGSAQGLLSFYGSKGILAHFVKAYFLEYRDAIKNLYHRFKK